MAARPTVTNAQLGLTDWLSPRLPLLASIDPCLAPSDQLPRRFVFSIIIFLASRSVFTHVGLGAFSAALLSFIYFLTPATLVSLSPRHAHRPDLLTLSLPDFQYPRIPSQPPKLRILSIRFSNAPRPSTSQERQSQSLQSWPASQYVPLDIRSCPSTSIQDRHRYRR